jgi:hypothetical protein
VVLVALVGVILFGLMPEPIMRLAEKIPASWILTGN